VPAREFDDRRRDVGETERTGELGERRRGVPTHRVAPGHLPPPVQLPER